MAEKKQAYIKFDPDSVAIETETNVYYGSYERYRNDGGLALPNGVTTMSYARNGEKEKLKSDAPSEIVPKIKDFITQVLASSHVLSEAYKKRLASESKAQGAINLENQRALAQQDFLEKNRSLTLDQAKDLALAEFKKQARLYRNYQNSEIYFISSLGYRFNGDQRSLDSMKNLFDNFDNQALIDGKLAFLDYDNVYRKLSKSDLQLLILETQACLFNLFQDIQTFKEKIRSALNKDELYSDYDSFQFKQFSFVPSDFTGKSLSR